MLRPGINSSLKTPKASGVIKPFLAGRDLKRYQTPETCNYLITLPKGWTREMSGGTGDAITWFKENYPAVFKHLEPFTEKAKKRCDQGEYWWELRACDYYAEFEKPKIIYQVFQVEPAFTSDTTGMYANNAIWIIPSTDKVLLGILNSKLGWFLISHYCTEIQRGYQLIFKYLGKIPIPVRDIDPQNKALQDEVTSLVDQMLDLHKQRGSEAQNFLRWLEGEIGVKVQDLRGASKLQEYYGMDFSGFHDLLIKNKRKLKAGYNPRGRENKELLEDEFNRSADKIRQFDARIEETDRQIDALVYKLYGLTEEEIKIVESGS